MEKKLPVEGSVSAVADATISHASSPAPSVSTYAEFWRAPGVCPKVEPAFGAAGAIRCPANRRHAANFVQGNSRHAVRIPVNGQFHARSDIDLAVEGLAPGDFFQALAQASKLSDFPIDLEPFEELIPHFAARVLATGEEI